MAPNIKNLVGELQFTDAEIHATRQGLDAAGISMPSFGNIGSALAKELNGPVEGDVAKQTILEEEEPLEEEPEPLEEPEPETLLSNQELRDLFWGNNTDSIVRCQQLFRGALERKRFLARRNLHYDMEEFLICLQAQGRGELARRRYRARLDELYNFEPEVVKVTYCFFCRASSALSCELLLHAVIVLTQYTVSFIYFFCRSKLICVDSYNGKGLRSDSSSTETTWRASSRCRVSSEPRQQETPTAA
jgi:hypothetical protein